MKKRHDDLQAEKKGKERMQTFKRNARSESLRENSEQDDANDYAFRDADKRVEASIIEYCPGFCLRSIVA